MPRRPSGRISWIFASIPASQRRTPSPLEFYGPSEMRRLALAVADQGPLPSDPNSFTTEDAGDAEGWNVSDLLSDLCVLCGSSSELFPSRLVLVPERDAPFGEIVGRDRDDHLVTRDHADAK